MSPLSSSIEMSPTKSHDIHVHTYIHTYMHACIMVTVTVTLTTLQWASSRSSPDSAGHGSSRAWGPTDPFVTLSPVTNYLAVARATDYTVHMLDFRTGSVLSTIRFRTESSRLELVSRCTPLLDCKSSRNWALRLITELGVRLLGQLVVPVDRLKC